MAKKNKIDVTELSVEELEERIDESKIRLQKLRFNHAVSPLDNPNVLKNIRRDIARFYTELRARELAEKRNG